MRSNKKSRIYQARDKKTGNVNGKWVFKNPVGHPSYYTTRKKAEKAQSEWTPNITRLVRDGYIQEGDTMELCFSGYRDINRDLIKVPLSVKHVKGTTMLFSYVDKDGTVKEISLFDVKKAVAEKKGTGKKQAALCSKNSMHINTKKSIHQLKKQYVEDCVEASVEASVEELKQFNFLDTFDSVTTDYDEKTPQPSTNISGQSTALTKFKEEFSSYFEKQVAAAERITHLDDEGKLKLCKTNLMSLLSI